MDVTTALLRIKRQFGDEYDVLINQDDIYGWIYEAELDIIRSTGGNDNVVNTTVGAFPAAVPSSVNIKRVIINGRALSHISENELDLVSMSSDLTGEPSYWYREGTNVHLYPTDAASTTAVKIEYSKTPVLMTGLPAANSFTVPEVHHPDVVRYCVARAHNKNQRTELEKIEMEAYDRNVSKRASETGIADTPQYKLGDPLDFNEYDWIY